MKSTAWKGQKITEAGCYSDMGLDAYHSGTICAGPSISSTGLRRLYSQSPAHFFDKSPYCQSPAEEDEPEHFILGRAAHHLLVGGPGHFSKEYVIRPDMAPDGRAWNGNNKTCIAWLDSMRKNNKTVLKPDHVEAIKGMAFSLGKHPLVAGGVLDGWIERSLFWQDKETGVWLKVRPDAIPKDGYDAADLKTTNSVQW